ncbi:peptidyl-prolyl cis-trans isomerase E-like [Copidosoma floridanum]|uniref:peptidyl-prolyl cis-trans isomerase E-like n=1 Tax=Copidosoma floridanum TaxID=29053 RepID=UPI0006C974AD|nr:peptidyl-prolyl cis-trans isomerase E-like [Copidosoma floridanum]
MVKKEAATMPDTPKFDPPIKPRYLPGEVHAKARQMDFNSYRGHRLRCANAKPKVDDKPPKLDVDVYHRQELMNEDLRTARVLCKANLQVVKKINAVSRLGGKVDCWNVKDRGYRTDQDLLKLEYEKIERENRALCRALNSLTSQLAPQVMAKEWKELKESIKEKSRFPWFKEVSRYPSISRYEVAPSAKEDARRPRCFFDLELASSSLPLGRIVFELYADFAPSICANFESFCRGFNGLSYKGTPFHRILSGYYCQGGDVTKFNGIGGASIYEDEEAYPSLADENLALRHACPGVLSTFAGDRSTALFDSKFNLTFRPLKTMDGKNVVFGKIVKGLPNLLKVKAYGTKYGKPLQRVIVANCGVLPLKSCNESA